MQMNCDHQSFFSQIEVSQKCLLAIQGCETQAKIINFYKFTYCYLNGHWEMQMIIMVLLIIILFRFMQLVIENHLTIAIQKLSKILKLSEEFSAVTLLAFANGASDVITALVASGDVDGIAYNIGALYGATLFVITIIVGVTIVLSNGIHLNPSVIWRDVGLCIITTIVIISYGIIGTLSLIDGLILIGIYVILIIFVSLSSQSQNSIKPSKEIHVDSEFNLYDYPFQLLIKSTILPNTHTIHRKEIICLILLPSVLANYVLLASKVQWILLLILIPITCIFVLAIWFYYTIINRILEIFFQIYISFTSLVWIYVCSSILIDLLTFFGMVTNLNSTYIGMTIIALGNALPDGLIAITLMKNGYQTMGMAGNYVSQSFGILVGLGLSLIKRNYDIQIGQKLNTNFNLFGQGGTMHDNLITLIMISMTSFVLITTFLYSICNQYYLSPKFAYFLILNYLITITVVTTVAVHQVIQS